MGAVPPPLDLQDRISEVPDSPSLRIAVDIGGTFTDSVLMDADGRVLASTKTLTTHAAPARGALDGVRLALGEAGRAPSEVTGFIHGTTLATNALIERRGARVATVTTEGFRDILEIAYERRYSQYDIDLQKPDLLVPRERAFTVRERIAADGSVLIPLEESALDPLIADLDAQRIEAVAVCLLHAYADPGHERRVREALLRARPGLAVSISSEVSPEAREFDRLSTTVANAYVQPLMSAYLAEFASAFAEMGISCPILMMTASGGMCTLETAARYPIRLVESGPAGGAILAARIAREAGLDEVLSFDMGGTTAKLCLIDRGQPQRSRQFEIARAARFIKGSGMPVRIPVVEMIEIGAGGGSIASVDGLGRLAVGPESAGSEPGPVGFDRGGTRPTVTDADIAQGYIVPDLFAEGRFAIDAAAAVDAIALQIGERLGMEAAEAARGISEVVDESMASAARMHAVESGKDLGARTMIAFGGNGPLHACRVARSAGVSRILVPPNPGVGSAVGFLFAPIAFELVRSRYTLLQTLDPEAIEALLVAMTREATEVVRQGAPLDAVGIRRSAFMRYRGQGHEIEIDLPERALRSDDVGPLTEAFETAYSRQFSRPVPNMAIEILNWAVRVATDDAHTGSSRPPPTRDVPTKEHRDILCDVTGRWREARVVMRDALEPGRRLAGPLLVCERQTTTFVAADFTCEADRHGNLILTREES